MKILGTVKSKMTKKERRRLKRERKQKAQERRQKRYERGSQLGFRWHPESSRVSLRDLLNYGVDND